MRFAEAFGLKPAPKALVAAATSAGIESEGFSDDDFVALGRKGKTASTTTTTAIVATKAKAPDAAAQSTPHKTVTKAEGIDLTLSDGPLPKLQLNCRKSAVTTASSTTTAPAAGRGRNKAAAAPSKPVNMLGESPLAKAYAVKKDRAAATTKQQQQQQQSDEEDEEDQDDNNDDDHDDLDVVPAPVALDVTQARPSRAARTVNRAKPIYMDDDQSGSDMEEEDDDDEEQDEDESDEFKSSGGDD